MADYKRRIYVSLFYVLKQGLQIAMEMGLASPRAISYREYGELR